MNKVAIITGGSRGIGKATALLLAKKGAKLTIASRHLEDLEKVSEHIEKMGSYCLPVQVDVANEKQVHYMVEETERVFGSIDILVNNAGLGIYKSITDTTEFDWNYTLDTNLKGVFFCVRAVVPKMIQQQRGCIVNIASRVGKSGFAYLSAYSAAKGGCIGFTMAVKRELAPHKIKVHCLCPGYVQTNFFQNFPPDFFIPHNTYVKEPEEVARDIFNVISANYVQLAGFNFLEILKKGTKRLKRKQNADRSNCLHV